MPDVDGFEILALNARRVDRVYHHECDRFVPNTPKARREHLRDCRREQAKARRAAARDRAREAVARLRQINAERAEARRVEARS